MLLVYIVLVIINSIVDRIRVLQYNILADAYTDFSRYWFSTNISTYHIRYSYCERDALSWDGYRKYNIAKEILHVNPDIITLQVHLHFIPHSFVGSRQF